MPEEHYQIFISHDREDSGPWAALLHDRLTARYGEGSTFQDVHDTPAGVLWRRRLLRQVRRCPVFVLLIGPGWNEERVQRKLAERGAWVRREIRTALGRQGKLIIPVLVGGAVLPPGDRLPDDIHAAVFARQHFRLSENVDAWKGDLPRLCGDIEAATGLVPVGVPGGLPVTPYEEAICRLDRHSEAGELDAQHEAGRRLFLASAGARAAPRHFALRCALEVVAEPGDQPVVKPLSWQAFAAHGEAGTRRRMLLREIEAQLCGDSGRPEEAARRIRERLARSRQPMVFFTVTARRVDAAIAREWFDTWHVLTNELGAGKIAVILFAQSGWWWAGGSTGARIGPHACELRSPLGKIHRHDFDDWLEAHVLQAAGAEARARIGRVGNGLFGLRRRRHLEAIDETVRKHWPERAGGRLRPRSPI